MSNRKKVKRLYHVRYVADFLVPAISPKQAFDFADEQMIDMVEGDECDLDEIFTITVENARFHVIEEIPEDELEDEDDTCEDDEETDDEDEDDEDEE